MLFYFFNYRNGITWKCVHASVLWYLWSHFQMLLTPSSVTDARSVLSHLNHTMLSDFCDLSTVSPPHGSSGAFFWKGLKVRKEQRFSCLSLTPSSDPSVPPKLVALGLGCTHEVCPIKDLIRDSERHSTYLTLWLKGALPSTKGQL